MLNEQTDFVSKVLKSYYKVAKVRREEQILNVLLDQTIPMILTKGSEYHCKVLEWSLKVVHRLQKYLQVDSSRMKAHLDEMMRKYQINSCLKGLYIKLLALITDTKDPA